MVVNSTFPKGAFTRDTQCCESFGGPDNADNIAGGLNQARVIGGAGSSFGNNLSLGYFRQIAIDNGATVTNNAPSVGAYSDSNLGQGFARAVAFATFTNTNSTSVNLKANAVLNGVFYPDSFGLPNGTMQGGAAIHVYDSDAFNAALTTAVGSSTTVDQTVGQYLLGSSGMNPAQDFANIAGLGGANLANAEQTYDNGPLYPTILSPTLTTSTFAVGPGKSFVVMFDVVASSVVGGSSASAGTGQVDFIDTLAPAANLFTDSNGNPVTGISSVSEFPSLPSAAAALSLAPVTGSALMEAPYAVTATATDSNGKPVPGVAVTFTVLTGPDKGITGPGLTGADGTATFTYHGRGGVGKDTIQATLGTIASNIVSVTWGPAICPEGPGPRWSP